MTEQTLHTNDSAPGDPSAAALGGASLTGGGKAVPDAEVLQNANSPGDSDSLSDSSMAGLPGETTSAQGMSDKPAISAADTDAGKDSGGIPTGGLTAGGTIGGALSGSG